jgi:hypothetical protein
MLQIEEHFSYNFSFRKNLCINFIFYIRKSRQEKKFGTKQWIIQPSCQYLTASFLAFWDLIFGIGIYK